MQGQGWADIDSPSLPAGSDGKEPDSTLADQSVKHKPLPGWLTIPIFHQGRWKLGEIRERTHLRGRNHIHKLVHQIPKPMRDEGEETSLKQLGSEQAEFSRQMEEEYSKQENRAKKRFKGLNSTREIQNEKRFAICLS